MGKQIFKACSGTVYYIQAKYYIVSTIMDMKSKLVIRKLGLSPFCMGFLPPVLPFIFEY